MKSSTIGLLYAAAAFVAWGLLPAYWKLLQGMPALEILSHRVVWSFVFVTILLSLKRQWRPLLRAILMPRLAGALFLSTLFITANWFLYIWAVTHNHILDTSFGYYINPLFSVLLGVVVMRERLNRLQWAAVGLAALGVAVMTAHYGRLPWIALTLSITFGLYGLCKKMTSVDSMIGLGIETGMLAPWLAGYILFRQTHGIGAFGAHSPSITFLLIFAGIVTFLPLYWFAQAAKFIPLSQVGFMQYISPTIALTLGVLVYHEPFSRAHLLGFSCIWGALLLYSLSHSPALQAAFRRSARG